MTLPTINPTTTKAWEALQSHYETIKKTHLKDLFEQYPDRATDLSIEWKDFYVDYSKNRIDKTTKKLLLDLAREVKLDEAIQCYFDGSTINETENRAVLHTALRTPSTHQVTIDGKNIISEVTNVKEKIKSFSHQVISGNLKGYTGKAFTDIVNIGIGGSDLGPAMITESLAYYKNHLNLHFISNVDGDHVHQNLKNLNPETTLFVVVSKTFSTQETISNATTARNWFTKNAPKEAVGSHFVAVSSNISNVTNFGIAEENIFPLWDWVGGRFSLWSAVGLSICLSIGYENFEALLVGAHEMDEHFKNTPFEENIPVILGMLSIWYNNFFNAESEAIIPYSQYLHRLPAYLQQGIMESNGKSIDRNGNPINYQTGTIIWGEPGTNAQHAFFQLIHQGTKLIPAEFIGFKHSLFGDQDHQNKLMANFFAQTEALMNGKTQKEVLQELNAINTSEETLKKLLPFKVFAGNKPTTTILIDTLTPKSLGALVSMYEQRIFVQGIIWNIFSYDQWGVELGKQLATTILSEIDTHEVKKHDSSTNTLLQRYLKKSE
ncbi:glucose-6-phosphate isomerase [Aquimarina sp. EL_43]|uniref:glucose-6-phosphate isomerase n=1 Tax=unclassified Aquimarina TaxID=2627091 RepID=UPI0018CAAFDD|nr:MULTISPECIES: glucose-6-phosphate isomerase [unclassified Aquimarina]MBG6133417.1 glucose-6-phosphate isomerase [Aquimarina sp. EL_35]MBG6153575.1 glucose-6-phosphate isomerase [Aquimarina sp. EL_32]MBG6171731.1 glucose-6-phosphate isomerase [Aquimarina sp. EL_43]